MFWLNDEELLLLEEEKVELTSKLLHSYANVENCMSRNKFNVVTTVKCFAKSINVTGVL